MGRTMAMAFDGDDYNHDYKDSGLAALDTDHRNRYLAPIPLHFVHFVVLDLDLIIYDSSNIIIELIVYTYNTIGMECSY